MLGARHKIRNQRLRPQTIDPASQFPKDWKSGFFFWMDGMTDDPFQLNRLFPVVKSAKRATLRRQQAACKRSQRRRQRKELILKYGGACAHCGFDDIRALCIDHVYGGGSAERGSFKDLRSYYDHLLTTEDVHKYQVLCANCNAIKRIENCEHGNNY